MKLTLKQTSGLALESAEKNCVSVSEAGKGLSGGLVERFFYCIRFCFLEITHSPYPPFKVL